MWVYLGIAAAVSAFLEGFWIWKERKRRKEDLQKISRSLELLLAEKELREEPQEETIVSKILHQIALVQRRSQGGRQKIQEDRDAMKKLIGEIAHQLRTPLTNIETYLDFLKEETGEEERRLYLEAVSVSEKKLRFLIESFIKMSRLEQKIIQLHREEGDLSQTLEQAVRQTRARASEKGVSLKTDFPRDLRLVHDANWLGEAVFNLLDNGVKYTEEGGFVCLGAEKNEMFLRIWVRDNGVGIQDEEEARLFQRFYRGKNVGSREGFGLGLYIAREIALLHRGFLRLKKQKQGTLAEIYLPAREESGERL